jgi:hypothetical protein
MRTHEADQAGTVERIVFIVNENGIDKVHQTLPKVVVTTFPQLEFAQDDQQRGRGSLKECVNE